MELRLKNEKPHFWQWDTGQVINVRGLGKCSFALLNNGVIGRSLRVPITADGAIWAVAVPDILLQHAEPVTVHICERTPGGVTTRHTQTFPVAARPKPENYVYTYEEVKTWDGLAGQISSLARNLGLVAERVTALEKLSNAGSISPTIGVATLGQYGAETPEAESKT